MQFSPSLPALTCFGLLWVNWDLFSQIRAVFAILLWPKQVKAGEDGESNSFWDKIDSFWGKIDSFWAKIILFGGKC
jgi:hypothetical protein